jgi:uncharacterized protein with GYD domain
MPQYLLQVAYNAEGWAALVKNPQDRSEAVRPAIEQLGGRIESFYMTFGEYDLVCIVKMPDNASAAAFSIAAAAGGAVKAIKTTPLMTTQEGVEAMRKAGKSSYRPAGATRARAAASSTRRSAARK